MARFRVKSPVPRRTGALPRAAPRPARGPAAPIRPSTRLQAELGLQLCPRHRVDMLARVQPGGSIQHPAVRLRVILSGPRHPPPPIQHRGHLGQVPGLHRPGHHLAPLGIEVADLLARQRGADLGRSGLRERPGTAETGRRSLHDSTITPPARVRPPGRPRAGGAGLASAITDKALAIIATGMTPPQAADWLLDNDASDVLDTATAGMIDLIPPDYTETGRTLTATIRADQHRTLVVTADRGHAPQPRPHSAVTLLRTAHHLNQLAAVLGEVVLEPAADGIPVCGRHSEEITCEVCQAPVGADLARKVGVTRPWHHDVTVCSVTCARAAHAGENNG